MPRLDLSADEADTLRDVLRTTLDELHTEISHTDDRDFREGLRLRQDTLEALARRLEQGGRQE
jgi:hypothetical protein